VWVLNNLGVLYTRERAYSRATEVLDRALQLARQFKDSASETFVEENRAALFLATGDVEQAELTARRAHDLAELRKDNTRRAAAFRLMARVTLERDRKSSHAIVLFERALALCELGEDVQLRAEILSDMGDAFRERGEVTRARDYWRRSLELARLAGFTSIISRLQTRMRSGASDRNSGATEAMAL
jgi:tetratricopeptide (TPR) repeat protein